MASRLPGLPRDEIEARLYLAMGMTLNACLRIALERPPELDRERLIDLVASMLLAGLGDERVTRVPPMGALPFDPIDEAARQWATHWDGVPQMHAVTSLMRVQQLVLGRLDALLKPLGLTFARYEALVLLSFSSRGSLPLGKMGERLQVHPTSVTSIVDRLEAAGLVVRRPHPEDGRAVLAEITPQRPRAGRGGDRRRSSAPTSASARSTRPTCAGSPTCSGPCGEAAGDF